MLTQSIDSKSGPISSTFYAHLRILSHVPPFLLRLAWRTEDKVIHAIEAGKDQLRRGLYYRACAWFLIANWLQRDVVTELLLANGYFLLGLGDRSVDIHDQINDSHLTIDFISSYLLSVPHLSPLEHKIFSRNITKNRAILLYRFHAWKAEFIPDYFTDDDVYYCPAKQERRLLDGLSQLYDEVVVAIWSYRDEGNFIEHVKLRGCKIVRVEDGFIRSIGLGADHTRPLSLCVDNEHLYFDSRGSSRLENLIAQYDFQADELLMQRASYCLKMILQGGISKYNFPDAHAYSEINKYPGKRKILVVGQVEDDESIRRGSVISYNNNDLVRLAAFENPDAHIIYKPHPDVLFGKRAEMSRPGEVAHLCTILTLNVPIASLLDRVDQVYTITSLVGFEAILRGKTVTVVGAPFYSGWGLTDDRQLTGRRQRKVTMLELFAAAYLLYPVYRGPEGQAWTCEQSIEYLHQQMTLPDLPQVA